jgi:glycosyltransferase involved in cell wall biosynthesis
MKIVHIITRLTRGGAEENTVQSCLHQARQGHEVYLFYGPDEINQAYLDEYKDLLRFRLIDHLVQPICPIRDVRALYELRRALHEIKPALVHTHTSKAGILGRFAGKMAGDAHIVHGVHILPFSHVGFLQKLVYLAIEHLAACVTDLFIHVSHGTRLAYLKAGIGKNKPHEVVYSGMDIAKFENALPPENWRALLKVGETEEKPKVLLMMAALEPRKRPLPFLSGFAKATNRGDPIRLVLAGYGHQQAEIETKIAELGLDDRVLLLGYYPEPERLIALADMGVLASVREGLPRVVVQYLAGNIPAIVSAIDGIEEIVDDGVTGLIVRDPMAEEVARLAVNTLKDESLYAKLKQGAKEKNVENWAFPSMFAALDKSYKLLAEKDCA